MRNTFRGSAPHLATRRRQRGATSTEYSLLVSFVALAVVAGVGGFGIALNDVFVFFADWLGVVI